MPHETTIGAIELWSGTIASIPPGWALCDGTNGTPDLTDQFVLGAAGNFAPGDTLDVSDHNHDWTSDAHSHALQTIGAVSSTPVNVNDDTSSDPATGTSTNTIFEPPWYSLAYVQFLGN